MTLYSENSGHRSPTPLLFCHAKTYRGYCRSALNSDVIQLAKDSGQVAKEYKITDIFSCNVIQSRGESNQVFIYICCYPRRSKKSVACKSSPGTRRQETVVLKVDHEKTLEDNWNFAMEWTKLLYEKLSANVPGAPSLSQKRKMLVVINPKSGKGMGVDVFKKRVAPILQNCGIEIELFVTQYGGHARERTTTGDLSFDGIVTVGGDGILYEVVNGVLSREDADKWKNIPFGVISCGSGNGLARTLAHASGESKEYLQDQVQASALNIARGRVTPINLMEVDIDGKKTHAFLTLGIGIISDIDIESEFLRWMGELRYTVWGFYRLATLPKYKATLTYTTVEGQQVTMENQDFVTIYASWVSYIGTDVLYAPTSNLGDGDIHLVYVKGDAKRSDVLSFLLSMNDGSHLTSKCATYVKVSEFSIDGDGSDIKGHPTVDGELCNGKRICVKSLSQKLNVFCL